MTKPRLPIEPVDPARSRAELTGPHLPPQFFSSLFQFAASVQFQIRRLEGSRIDCICPFRCERRFRPVVGDARPRRLTSIASPVNDRKAKPCCCQARANELSSRWLLHLELAVGSENPAEMEVSTLVDEAPISIRSIEGCDEDFGRLTRPANLLCSPQSRKRHPTPDCPLPTAHLSVDNTCRNRADTSS